MAEQHVPDWFYRQSAAIPYRIVDDLPEILLITTRKKKRWIAPKGVIDPGYEARESALKEAYEEAGAIGEITGDEQIGEFTYDKWGGTCIVQVFAMRVTRLLDEWEEGAERERRWFKLDKAVQFASPDDLGEIIARTPSFLRKFGILDTVE
ncbi:MAG: NUDIX hydrolase [Ectothiorhodospiraceae bacterium]|nr:NUDIX hydrolase [Ectothiorhodospiraceae bacterium]